MQNVVGEKGLRVISSLTCEAGKVFQLSFFSLCGLFPIKKKGVYWSLLKGNQYVYSRWQLSLILLLRVKAEIRSGTLRAGKPVGAKAGPVPPGWCLHVVYVHEQNNDFGASPDFPNSQKCISGLVLESFSYGGELWKRGQDGCCLKLSVPGQQLSILLQQQVPSCPLQMGNMIVLGKYHQVEAVLGFQTG